MATLTLRTQNCQAQGRPESGISRLSAPDADKILKGTEPTDLPVQQPSEFEFVIHLQIVEALGIASRSHRRRSARGRYGFIRSPPQRLVVASPNNTTGPGEAARVSALVVALLAFQHLRPTSHPGRARPAGVLQ
jgi:hypothetical protein